MEYSVKYHHYKFLIHFIGDDVYSQTIVEDLKCFIGHKFCPGDASFENRFIGIAAKKSRNLSSLSCERTRSRAT